MKVSQLFLIICLGTVSIFGSFAHAQFLCELKNLQSNKTLSHFEISDESSGQSVQIENYWAGIYVEYQIVYLRLEDDLENLADHEYHGDFKSQLKYEVNLQNAKMNQQINFRCTYEAH